MTTVIPNSVEPEVLRYLWTPDLNPLFWRPARLGVSSAWYGHIPFAHWIVRAVKPRTLIELGTQNGVSYSAFCEAVVRNGFDTRCYAVDTWQGDDQAGHYGEEVYLDFRRFHDERYGAFSELLRCTFDDALAYVPDSSVDLLHIDGLHIYEAVRHDFESWRPKLTEAAVVLFHDTNLRKPEFGVWRLWEELRRQFPSFEFLHGYGLGVLAVGRSISAEVSALCSLSDPVCVYEVRERFSLLGERWMADQRERLQEGEVAARDARILSMEAEATREVAARDARIFSMEAEAARSNVEAARRTAAEEQIRARAAQRTSRARREAASATERVAKVAAQAARAPIVQAAPSVPIDEAAKLRFVENLRQELAVFLRSGQRLSFRADEAPDVSIVILLYNQAHFTYRCLRSVMTQAGVKIEVVLVDNCSTDDTEKLLASLDNVRVLRNSSNVGFLLGVNQGAKEARGRNILLLNNDAFMRENALASALHTLESNGKIGVVGGKMILPSGRLQEAGSIIWSDASTVGYARDLLPNSGEAMFRRDVDYCSACFFLTPRALFERMGGFNLAYVPIYYEETDYCLRLWRDGLRVVYEPRAVVDHYETGTMPSDAAIALLRRNRKFLRQRHSEVLQLRHLPPSRGNLLFARDHVNARRRLLVIENEVPLSCLGSGYPRMRALLNAAVEGGWFVTLYPLHLPTVNWETAYAELSGEIEICDGLGVAGLAEFMADRQGYYDAILVSRPDNMALFKEAVLHQPHVIDGARLIYDAEAIFATRTILQAELNGHPMNAIDANALMTQEIEVTANVDSVVTVTKRDAEHFRKNQVAPVHVLSHLTRVAWDAPGFKGREGFLFIGRLLEKNMPNYEGLSWFLSSVWPAIRARLGDVNLTAVGALHSEPTELMAPGVQLIGPVEDVRPLYDGARVFLSPIRFAAGISIKILEAAAAGLPVVGTKLMAQQLGWQPGTELEAGDDPAQMAKVAIALYDDAERWESVRVSAWRRLSSEHSEEVFRRGLRAVLEADGNTAVHVPQGDDATDTHRISRVNAVWSAGEPPKERGQLWMAHPTVRACVNKRASGDPGHDSYVRLKQLLSERGWALPVDRAVSLCCGAGELERGLAGLGIAQKFFGYDLSEAAITKARALAGEAGLNQLEYEIRDLERQGIDQSNVDLVFAHSAIHHIARLEELLDAVHAALRPGGIFHLNEYVGPDRFQWTDQQLKEMNDFLDSLPEHYRYLPNGVLRTKVERPTIEFMLQFDPSEAVRSSEIEARVAERFNIIERRALGGALLHMALSDIAQNFDPEEKEDQAHLQRLIDREDRLMADHILGTDFLVVVAQRKD